MHVPGRLWNNPHGEEAVDRIVTWLDLHAGQEVLDVGCGTGEILARVIERYGCRGVGVDADEVAIGEARTRLAGHAERVRLIAAPIDSVALPEPFDAAMCIGSTHAYGGPGEGYRRTLQALERLVRPGGLMLVGEGYWRREPDPAYLEATGIGAADFTSHEENVAIAEAAGLIPLAALTSSRREWDLFESATWRAAELALARDPADEGAQATARHRRGWRRAYLRWGRDTLGFALYLFRVGVTPPSSGTARC